MITAPIQGAQAAQSSGTINIAGQIDILTPIAHHVAGRPGDLYPGNQRPQYANFLSGSSAYDQPGTAPNSLWMYTACPSHGCWDADSANWDGFPGYAIDQPASEARAMGWIAFAYDVSGELYWDVSHRLEQAWSNQYEAGGNGDGTLFYPGFPGGNGAAPAIGGTHPIPIESLRLKRIRDGREDYELLKLLADQGQGLVAKQILEGLFGDADHATFGTDVSQSDLDAARCELFDAVLGSSNSCQ
jgi:hypothetical protein